MPQVLLPFSLSLIPFMTLFVRCAFTLAEFPRYVGMPVLPADPVGVVLKTASGNAVEVQNIGTIFVVAFFALNGAAMNFAVGYDAAMSMAE